MKIFHFCGAHTNFDVNRMECKDSDSKFISGSFTVLLTNVHFKAEFGQIFGKQFLLSFTAACQIMR